MKLPENMLEHVEVRRDVLEMSVFVGVQHLVHEVDVTEVVARTALVLYLSKWMTKFKKDFKEDQALWLNPQLPVISIMSTSLLLFPLSVVQVEALPD